MIVVHGRFPIRPDAADRFRALLPELIANTRRDEGCLSYECLESTETPGEFLFVEQWESAEMLAKHLAAEHLATATAALPGLLAGEPSIVAFDSEGPKPLAL